MAHLAGIFIGIFGAVIALLGYFDQDTRAVAAGLVCCLAGVFLLCREE